MLGPAFVVSPGLLQKIYGARDDAAVRTGVGLNAAALLLFAIVPVLLGMMARTAYPVSARRSRRSRRCSATPRRRFSAASGWRSTAGWATGPRALRPLGREGRTGMCSAAAVWRPRREDRTWLATRRPRWKHSTVRAVSGPSSCRRTSDLDMVVDVDANDLPLGEDVGSGGQGTHRGLVKLLALGPPRARKLAEGAR